MFYMWKENTCSNDLETDNIKHPIYIGPINECKSALIKVGFFITINLFFCFFFEK